MRSWHVISPEYPPVIGGVGDHSRLLARELAASGQQVSVWTTAGTYPHAIDGAFEVHTVGSTYSPMALRALGRRLSRSPKPRTLLIQWVPHGYGYKSVNLPFCLWVAGRAVRGDRVELIVHEAYLGFGGGARQSVAAALHRVMISVLLLAASRVWVTIPAWRARLKPYAFGRGLGFHWLPVPSTVPVSASESLATTVRQRYLSSHHQYLIGHFGSLGPSVRAMLDTLVPQVLKRHTDAVWVLIGATSIDYAEKLRTAHPSLADRIAATGVLPIADVSPCIAACDVAVQPYPDGISARRTSSMSMLAHGVALVSNTGFLSESLWQDEPGLAMVTSIDLLAAATSNLLNDAAARRAVGAAGAALYAREFSSARMVERLLATEPI